MSKEYLEAYFKIDHTLCLNSQNIKFGMDADEHIDCQNIDEVVNCLETIKEALQRLESIDNANPSEALKCLEEIRERFSDDSKGNNSWGFKISQELNTIKQALLKAQEPKQYLKWEDLEFEKKEQTMKVLLNGKMYLVKYANEWFCGWGNRVHITNGTYVLCTLGDGMKQFFNDLHLERVEE